MARPRALKWETNDTIIATVRGHGRILHMGIQRIPGHRFRRTTFAVFAVEAKAREGLGFTQPTRQLLDQVLDGHSHQVLEPQFTMRAAKALAAQYVAWWQRSGATGDPCPCGPIEARDITAGGNPIRLGPDA